MIEIDRVSFVYRPGDEGAIPALREISLRVADGQFAAIIGQNGSGKSTLLKLLTALVYPTAGEIRVDGIPVEPARSWDIRSRVAAVFQDPDDQLIAARVRDDVAFGPENLGLPREEIGRRVEWALEALGLASLADALIEDLSPAQKQQVAIAGALAMLPQFIILDEPTSLLPRPAATRLLSTLRYVNRERGTGVLHITHHMAEAALFDRVIVLDRGHVVMDGTPREVFRRPEWLRSMGLDVPAVVDLAERLRSAGVPVSADPLDAAELSASLTRTGSHGR